MSAYGTKQTSISTPDMSAFGGKAARRIASNIAKLPELLDAADK
jgi:hypothetical protein